MIDPVKEYTDSYRKNMQEFRSKYPQEYERLKQAYIEAYAALPERAPTWDEIAPDLESSVWKKLAAQGRITDASEKAKRLFINEVYPAMWEEIMQETDGSNTPQQIKQRMAICNLGNYTIEASDCCMPPWVRMNYRDDSGIVCLPHPLAHTEEWRDHHHYTRIEALSPLEQELALWYRQNVEPLYARLARASGPEHNACQAEIEELNTEYTHRYQAINTPKEQLR